MKSAETQAGFLLADALIFIMVCLLLAQLILMYSQTMKGMDALVIERMEEISGLHADGALNGLGSYEFVSVPLVLMLQWLSKAVYAHEYLIQVRCRYCSYAFTFRSVKVGSCSIMRFMLSLKKKNISCSFIRNDSLSDLVTKFSCIRSNKENLR